MLLSILILAVILTYIFIPLVKYVRRFFRRQAQRVEQAFQDENEISKEDLNEN